MEWVLAEINGNIVSTQAWPEIVAVTNLDKKKEGVSGKNSFFKDEGPSVRRVVIFRVG